MELQVFNNAEFGSVRSIMVNDEPYFVGKDVADILGYSNTRDALAKHVDDADKWVWKDVKSKFTHFANNDVVIAKITPCF